MSEINEMTVIPLRKKYYDGEQVIRAVVMELERIQQERRRAKG